MNQKVRLLEHLHMNQKVRLLEQLHHQKKKYTRKLF